MGQEIVNNVKEANNLVKNHLNEIIGDRLNFSSSNNQNRIMENLSCPFCKANFTPDTSNNQFNFHLKKCGLGFVSNSVACDLIPPSEDLSFSLRIQESAKNYLSRPPISTKKDFNLRLEDLKVALKKRKISWEKGCCHLHLNRSNFLVESMKQIEGVDLFKELKIDFIGEVSLDAGGILREWFTTVFKALENQATNLFVVSDTEQFSYNINPFLMTSQNNLRFFTFIGKMIGKAMLDNITINLCLNKIVYKMILNEKIEGEDLIFIDSPLYNSLKNLEKEGFGDEKNNSLSHPTTPSLLSLSYSLNLKDSNGHLHTVELVKDGAQKQVFSLEDYTKKRINFLIGVYEPFVRRIRDELFRIVPKEKLMNFNSDELELILNGRPYIDVEEWKLFTVYKAPYSPNHRVIKWFWEIMEKLEQVELSNLLMFCTGSNRVPLGGFGVLESNRGNVSRFTIECVPYIYKSHNYIKAHTCFNRLDVPSFPSKKELEEAIFFVSKNEILGFGID